MIKSMTGFGRHEVCDENHKITVELKAVNHRYLDVNTKMPKKLYIFESAIRNLLKDYIQRGKVDVFIQYEDYTEGKSNVKYNPEIAEEYLKYLTQMAETFHLENDIRVSTLSRYPDVFSMEEVTIDEEELWKQLQDVVKVACEGFVNSRIREGEQLKTDLLAKLDEMDGYVDFIEERFPQIIVAYRERLLNKIHEVLDDPKIDEARIATEVTIFSDRICVDEEMVRLRSHISGVKQALIEGGSIGRKLDFIAQEMNREANTILSKSNDLEITNVGIELKTCIEKVREQIQNIE